MHVTVNKIVQFHLLIFGLQDMIHSLQISRNNANLAQVNSFSKFLVKLMKLRLRKEIKFKS
jgi:hypothetical protein